MRNGAPKVLWLHLPGVRFERRSHLRYLRSSAAAVQAVLPVILHAAYNDGLGATAAFFEQGEPIWTESSYRYSPTELERCAGEAGFALRRMWCDRRRWFMVGFFEVL